MGTLAATYKTKIAPELQKSLGYTNRLQVPALKKVVLNVGVGKFIKERQHVENVINTLTRITGLKPVETKTKKAISNFKTREGMVVGVMVTLRGKRMYDFIEKLVNVTLPRVRDFHGISRKSFDKAGNYSLGFREHLSFPEIRSDEIETVHGIQVTIHTTAKNKEEGLKLLEALGFPFTKENKK